MKRTRKMVMVMVMVMGLALPVLYFGSANEAAAFCVYNEADVSIQAKQVHGGTHIPFKNFDMNVNPGEKACCNWQTHDCNTEGKEDSNVKFSVYYAPMAPRPGAPPITYICTRFETHANGKVVVRGKQGEYTCKRE